MGDPDVTGKRPHTVKVTQKVGALVDELSLYHFTHKTLRGHICSDLDIPTTENRDTGRQGQFSTDRSKHLPGIQISNAEEKSFGNIMYHLQDKSSELNAQLTYRTVKFKSTLSTNGVACRVGIHRVYKVCEFPLYQLENIYIKVKGGKYFSWSHNQIYYTTSFLQKQRDIVYRQHICQRYTSLSFLSHTVAFRLQKSNLYICFSLPLMLSLLCLCQC